MKFPKSFFCGLAVLVAATALAQFGTNYPMSITANTAFGTNAPGSLTASNRFGTNAPGWLTASNYFGTNAPGSLTASNRFGTNAPGSLTASNTFAGGAQRVGIVTTNVVTVGTTNSTTNFVVLAGSIGAGSYYSTTNTSVPYRGTNGIFFSYNPSAGGMYAIETTSNQLYATKMFSTSAAGNYGDAGYGTCVVSNGTGTFSWIVTTNTTLITTNYP